METTWGPSGGYGDDGDDVGTTWTMLGRCGDDVGMTGTTWGDHRPWRPHGDLLGSMGMTETTGMTWG